MFSNSPLDWGLVIAYFVFLGAVWLSPVGRATWDAADYLVAGRRVTLPAFVATLVATWYGGILGVGEYSYRYGLANWLVFGAPYYIGALLFALFFARRAREAALYTIPDLLARRSGRGPALAAALAVFVIAAPAAYVLMLGTLFSSMTRLPLAPCVIAAAVFSLFYVQRRGLRAVVFTDQVQFVLMYVGMGVMVVFLVARHGGLPFLAERLPATHLTWHGGNPWPAILVWYFIALSALVDPAFWQRAYAARDPRVARRGVLWSIAFWIVFDFMTTATGLYARALLPNLADPLHAFPAVAQAVLPPLALGMFYVGMIATVMSTIDSYGFIAATTFGRDFVWRLRGEASEERIAQYSRIGLLVACVFATVLALARPTVIGLWHDLGSITTPALLLPVATALIGRSPLGSRGTLAAMIVPFAVSLGWLLMKNTNAEGVVRYPGGLEPIYLGLLASLAIYGVGWMWAGLRRRPVAACTLGLLLFARGATAQEAPDTLNRVVPLPEVVVSTTRAAQSPFARSTLGRDELKQRVWGQDTPMALATLPGAYAYSDAGNGIGYSYLSIRGFPQRRISVLINGVPLNDPESHEVFWVDHPDLLASTAEAQVQRGVGSALYGAASVGGSVHLETAPFAGQRSFAAAAGYGSFDTRRLMLEGDSGPLEGGWNLYGRYSRIETDGYRDRSDTQLWSYALSARRLAGSHSLRLNLYGGPEETHLAYLGVPRAVLDGGITGDPSRDRRFNPISYEGERDHFFEPHYELIHSWSLSPRTALTQTLFYFDGEGFYDEQRFGQPLTSYGLTPWATNDSTLLPRAYYRDTDNDGNLDRDAQGRATVERFDLVRKRWIHNRHYGWVPRIRIEHPRGALTAGGEIRAHDGHHIGTVLSASGLPPGAGPDHVYYDYHPRTLSAGLFLREEWRVTPALEWTADLAWRHQGYEMRGDRFGGIQFDQPYDFLLPRLGARWKFRDDASLFAAVAHSRREPALRDLYDGEAVGNVPLITAGTPRIRPERVNDYELGLEWGLPRLGPGAKLEANLFHMDFRDELVYAGQFATDLGYPILGNAASSVHQGVELSGKLGLGTDSGPRLELDGNATFSDNHFVRYGEEHTAFPGGTVSYDGNAIGFFPATLGNLSIRGGWRGASLGLEAQHAGRLYLDHNENKDASIGPRTIFNLHASGGALRGDGFAVELGLRVFNLLDRKYETGGYMDFDTDGGLSPRFIPAATRHVLGEVRVEW